LFQGDKNFCKNKGYERQDPNEKICSSGSCKKKDCCFNTQQQETCADFFNRAGKNICQNNNYSNKAKGEKKCDPNYGCHADECCKDPYQTCENFLNGKKAEYCSEKGYMKENKNNVCTEKDDGTCSAKQCCTDPKPTGQTCGNFFKGKDKKICDNNGFQNKIEDAHVCTAKEDGTCSINQCCTNLKNFETCGEFFQKNGKGICTDNGFPTNKNDKHQCTKDVSRDCTVKQCCKQDSSSNSATYQTCGDFLLGKKPDFCANKGYSSTRGNKYECTAKDDGTCNAKQCCYN